MTYPFSDMSQREIDDFLQAPRHATFATNRTDGPPQITPVWYLYENGQVYVSIFKDSYKYKNLNRDQRVSLCIVGDHPDARGVTVSGTAEVIDEDGTDWIGKTVWRLMRRYHESDEDTQTYIDNEGPRGRSALVVITPNKILAQDFNETNS